jgi:N-acetylglutamate synthase-like GNAT family acetyltransferase
VELSDDEILSDPKKCIIDKGSFIFFATADGEIAGTFALIKIDNDRYELSKIAVDEGFQGNQTGNRMPEFCIDEVKKL